MTSRPLNPHHSTSVGSQLNVGTARLWLGLDPDQNLQLVAFKHCFRHHGRGFPPTTALHAFHERGAK